MWVVLTDRVVQATAPFWTVEKFQESTRVVQWRIELIGVCRGRPRITGMSDLHTFFISHHGAAVPVQQEDEKRRVCTI